MSPAALVDGVSVAVPLEVAAVVAEPGSAVLHAVSRAPSPIDPPKPRALRRRREAASGIRLGDLRARKTLLERGDAGDGAADHEGVDFVAALVGV